jgi:hypothetical protein
MHFPEGFGREDTGEISTEVLRIKKALQSTPAVSDLFMLENSIY